VNWILVTTITKKRTVNDNRKVTKLERIAAKIYMYFGTYTVLKIAALVLIDFMAAVDPDIKT
jgi:hypothetical protein